MAAPYKIGDQEFYRWDGPPPKAERERVVTRGRVGVDFMSYQLTGLRQDIHQVTLDGWFDTFENALLAHDDYLNLITTGLQDIVHDYVDYTTNYNLKYQVVNLVEISVFTAHLLGPDVHYTDGAVARYQWSLVPVTVDPPVPPP